MERPASKRLEASDFSVSHIAIERNPLSASSQVTVGAAPARVYPETLISVFLWVYHVRSYIAFLPLDTFPVSYTHESASTGGAEADKNILIFEHYNLQRMCNNFLDDTILIRKLA